MNDVPRELLQKAYKRSNLPLLKIPLLYGMWAACGWVIWSTMDTPWGIPIGVACSLLICNLVRGLGAIGHDAVHGSVARNKTLGYLIGLLCWFPTGMSFTIYSIYHLHHHKIANTYADVDNFVVIDYTRHPLLARLLTLAVFSFAYPIYFMFQMFRYVPRLTWPKRVRMYAELGLWFAAMAACIMLLPTRFFLFIYGLPFVFGAVLASVTEMIEHYEKVPGPDAYSSRTYGTRNPVYGFLWSNVCFHNEHHSFPGIPWYNLRWFHQQAFPYYDDHIKRECCHEGFFDVAFHLYGRILKLDVASLEARYADVGADAADAALADAGLDDDAIAHAE